MKVAFYSRRIQIEGDWLEKRGLGGSESALINLTTVWKKLFPNDTVIIYNGQKREIKTYNGVEYKTLYDFDSERHCTNYDAFISLRDHQPFYVPYLNAKLKCMWSQDDMNESSLQDLRTSKYATTHIDLFFAISEYAKKEIEKGFPGKTVLLQRNGYRSEWIEDPSEIIDQPIAVYASTPFRGLDILASTWSKIYMGCISKGVIPTLRVYTSMSLYNQPDDNFKELYNSLTSQPGVEFHGAKCQKDLYHELSKAKVMLYPNHFLETGCMAVLEALACNLWVVTTDLGALGEQVREGVSGFLIPGDARSIQYQDKFIQLSIDSLCEFLRPKTTGLIFSWDEQVNKMRESILERI